MSTVAHLPNDVEALRGPVRERSRALEHIAKRPLNKIDDGISKLPSPRLAA